MTIAATISVLKTRLQTCHSITTVLDYVTEQDPAASLLPLICIKVNAARTKHEDGSEGGTFDRRTLYWPLDLYVFGCIRTKNIAADLATTLPLWEEVVGVLDGDLTLGGTLDSTLYYADPMGGDPGAIAWVKTTYTGFVLHPILPILSSTPYS